MLGHVSSTYVDSLASVVDCETLEDRGSMADTITAIEDQASCLTSGVQTENCLLLEEELWCRKFLKEQVSCLNSVLNGVEWCLSQQDRMFLGGDLQLIKDM